MKGDKSLLNKYCTLEFRNGFLLDGLVVDINEFGIVFETSQKTSFISWYNIKELVPKDKGEEFGLNR